ncbi:MAG: 4-hydroxy-tetrahydrodipicolinate reductase [Tidjanibacter sp.]|nr:4-hydroxy-tetrahydrodipicolinate reductase [Tidjanibacter sp.]
MKVAIIGYGKMGHEIEKVLRERGHEVVATIDVDNRKEMMTPEVLLQADVAIEFTSPSTAYDNIRTCIEAGVAVLSGSTGWTERKAELDELCRRKGGAFFYSSNYSVGVNVLFRLNRWLAAVMGRMPQYEVGIEEVHHIHKLDAPSGTAATLAEEMRVASGGALNVKKEEIVSVREGEVPGIHTITYDSEEDTLTVSHSAKSRRGLALGAVLAAEWLVADGGRTGVFSMDDFLKI